MEAAADDQSVIEPRAVSEESVLWRFAASLCVGLLMGLVRERNPHAQAGVRTFALVAVLGTSLALLAQAMAGSWLPAAGLVALAWMMVQATRNGAPSGDAGTTSTVAVMVCFGLGAMIWTGPLVPAVVMGLVATGLLHFKPELEGFATRLSAADVTSILRFAVLTVLILPLLPDRPMGPYGVLNPYRVWLMVVLISGISLSGYLFVKLFGSDRGAVMAGVLGGLISSTATTLAFARRVRNEPAQLDGARTAIVLASTVVMARLMVFTALIDPAGLRALTPMLLSGFGVGLAFVLVHAGGADQRQPVEVSNPGELRAALAFAALFAGVQFATAWLERELGEHGLYLASLASGAVDLDAIALSLLHRHVQGGIEAGIVARCLALAYGASLVIKALLALVLGGRRLGRAVLLPFGAITLGLLVTFAST